jgi:hypothetical protein
MPKASLAARSFERVAMTVSNRDSASGCAGFLCRPRPSSLYLLDGNQNDQVNISPFKTLKFSVAIWLKDEPSPQALSTSASPSAEPLLSQP